MNLAAAAPLPAFLALFAVLRAADSPPNPGASDLAWQALPGMPETKGLAGVMGGVSHGQLLITGGNNFLSLPPWEGGVRHYNDLIWMLDLGTQRWKTAKIHLPLAPSYGTCGRFGNDVILVGGNTADGPSSRIFRLSATGSDVQVAELAALPIPLYHAASATIGRWMFIAGGISQSGESLRRCWVGEYRSAERDISWTEIEPWPGPSRQLAVAGTDGRSFYLFSGQHSVPAPSGPPTVEKPYLRDAYVYDFDANPIRGKWRRLADLPRPVAAAPGQALFSSAQKSFFIAGGLAGDDQGILPQNYPPFPNVLSIYSPAGDSWRVLNGVLPDDLPRATAPWMSATGGWIVAGGEIRPGRRTATIYRVVIDGSAPTQ